jgi:predicted AAA+ superfamily ATPase
MRMLAGRVGQLLNLNPIVNDLGISGTTLRQWISVLEASHIIFLLPPYIENIGKRVSKSPKLYFVDTGLASYLLGINDPSQVTRDPLLGGLFENLVVAEALKSRRNQGADPNLYFYRDNHQHEVDIIFKTGRELIPVEIKAAMTYSSPLTDGIAYFRKISGSGAGFLVYAGEMEMTTEKAKVVNFRQTHTIFGGGD